MQAGNCPFCNPSEDRLIAAVCDVVAIGDEFPIAKGRHPGDSKEAFALTVAAAVAAGL